MNARYPQTAATVAIIGGGFAGIAAGVKLKAAGLNNFTIFESAEAIGGTWWYNRYPGAEVDVTSHLYSYSFRQSAWSRTHVGWAELLNYLNETVDEFGLRDHIRLNSNVTEASWDDDRGQYLIRTEDGLEEHFTAVISAVGFLNVPAYPSWPGLDQFQGPTLHTARWEETDLRGKTVAVVGTGSSASQVVVTVAPEVEKLLVFQREPGWVLPKADRDYTAEEKKTLLKRSAQMRKRRAAWLQAESIQFFGSMNKPKSLVNRGLEKAARGYIGKTFADRPDLAAAVTPRYPYGGKRSVLSREYYPTLKRDNVELVPHAVASVTPTGIVDARGVEHAADVLVMATGFKPSDFVSSMRVTGRTGRTLQDYWKGEPHAFLGILVPEFPNFFMMYGPNTNGGEVVSNLERQAEYAARTIRKLAKQPGTRVEVSAQAEARYNERIQKALKKTSWALANNYYKTASGRIVTQWPYGITLYRAAIAFLAPRGERFTVREPHAPHPAHNDTSTTTITASAVEQ